MRVVVDPDLCEGNAVCVTWAPEVFEVGDDDQAKVKIAEPDASLHEKVKLAAKRCPRQAIKLVD
jgi:ferredoxin